MMTIKLIQFVRPNGLQIPVSTQLPDDCAAPAQVLEDLGLRLTAEIIPGGVVALCINHLEIGDYACELTQNGPAVQEKLREMLLAFSREDYEDWAEEQEQA